jgi:hypothetical protein
MRSNSCRVFCHPRVLCNHQCQPPQRIAAHAGLASYKADMASKLDPLSLITSMSQLCALVPQTNSTDSLLVAGVSKFLNVMTTMVLPAAGNNTAAPAAALVGVLGALGSVATTGAGGFDLSAPFSLSSLLDVVKAFSSLLAVAKLVNLV